jgi:hypothetical protein
MDQLKQFIPLIIAAPFLVRAVYPKPIFLKTTRDRAFVVKDSTGQKLAYVYFEG